MVACAHQGEFGRSTRLLDREETGLVACPRHADGDAFMLRDPDRLLPTPVRVQRASTRCRPLSTSYAAANSDGRGMARTASRTGTPRPRWRRPGNSRRLGQWFARRSCGRSPSIVPMLGTSFAAVLGTFFAVKMCRPAARRRSRLLNGNRQLPGEEQTHDLDRDRCAAGSRCFHD
jgi:hypothetical protein